MQKTLPRIRTYQICVIEPFVRVNFTRLFAQLVFQPRPLLPLQFQYIPLSH